MTATPLPGLQIRAAVPADLPALLTLVRRLAIYERLDDQMVATKADFERALFSERPVAEAILGMFEERPVAFALYFQSFSTFVGRAGLYLEDLFVEEEFRGRGFGKTMFLHVARIATERGCGRMEWAALTWNEPAIRFYQGMGAQRLDEWRTFRLTGDQLRNLARH